MNVSNLENQVNIALIPARSGSLAVKKKNLQKISGTSLVRRTYLQALESKIFERIIISTDSFEIIREISNNFTKTKFDALKADEIILLTHNIFLHKRDSRDADALSPIRDVLFKLSSEIEFSTMWLLQPTSPFRFINEFKLLDQLINQLILEGKHWSSIVSCRSAAGVHPDRMFRFLKGYAVPYLTQTIGENAPRQLLEELYIKDGAYYVLQKENLKRSIFLGDAIVPFVRSGIRTINIDSPEDLLIAQIIGDRINSETENFLNNI